MKWPKTVNSDHFFDHKWSNHPNVIHIWNQLVKPVRMMYNMYCVCHRVALQKISMQIFICSVAPPGGENQKSASIASKNVISRFYCKKNFWISGHHVAVATGAKFECQKIKNAFRLRKLRGRDPLFWFLSIIRICSFIWNGQNMFLNNLQISGFISTESLKRKESSKRWRYGETNRK